MRALPLGVIDVVATFAAYYLAVWGTQDAPSILGEASAFGCLVFFALVNVIVYAACKMNEE